jgi:predicted nucleic acid-binding protein
MTEERDRPRVYLDTNAFIRAFEEEQDIAVRALFEEFRRQPKMAVTSELTLAELLAPVQRKGVAPLSTKRRFYLGLIVWSRFTDLLPVSRAIWLETADIRQHARLKLPDAVHIVTAIHAGCSYFISADNGTKRLPQNMIHIVPDAEGVRTLMDAIRA